jgi:hypothetical protein
MSRVRVPSLTPTVRGHFPPSDFYFFGDLAQSAPTLPALGAAVQPNGKNHDSHQDDHPDADSGQAGGPEGRPDSSEEMPMPSPSSS